MVGDLTVRYIPARNLVWVVCGLFLCFLPHVLHLPIWISVTTTLFFILKLYLALQHPQNHSINRSITLNLVSKLIMVGGFIGVYLTYKTLVGRDAGSALLILLAGFKVLETEEERDFYVTTFLGFFIIITNFFYSQSIATAMLMLVTVIVLMASLVAFNDRSGKLSNIECVRNSGKILLQTLPFMLLSFLLFPRIDGPLWGMPKDAHAGQIGISDEMEPGSLNNLISSNAVAFRVEFNGQIPPRKQLYWRGPVLWHDDGRKWTRPAPITRAPGHLNVQGAAVNYTVTMEPTNKKWLFALEMPDTAPANGYIGYDTQFIARSPITQRIQYTVNSYPEYHLGYADKTELQRSLQLPINKHPKTVALGEKWREEIRQPELIVKRALRMFNEENFYYTLKPPLLPGDNTDEFLFNTRQGFCEHYAAAFVTLMRAAGIPARVVTGYLGGTLNPIGNYLVVYQRDAHAWAEVWLKNSGWTQVDPTSVVAPARVEQGIEEALPGELTDVPSVFGSNDISRHVWITLRYTWDSINNQWNQWFISYGPKRQQKFLQFFGFENIDLQWLAFAMMTLIAVFFLLLAYWFGRQPGHTRDPARLYYDKFCSKLGTVGIKRKTYEGPEDFARRIATSRVKLKNASNLITALYISVRYGDDKSKLDELRRSVNTFRPARILRQ